jgi:hypothetical protein
MIPSLHKIRQDALIEIECDSLNYFAANGTISFLKCFGEIKVQKKSTDCPSQFKWFLLLILQLSSTKASNKYFDNDQKKHSQIFGFFSLAISPLILFFPKLAEQLHIFAANSLLREHSFQLQTKKKAFLPTKLSEWVAVKAKEQRTRIGREKYTTLSRTIVC